MKKNKLLIPILGLPAIAAGSLPLAMLSSCHKEDNKIGGVIPISALDIGEDGVLHGFKEGVNVSKYDTLSIPADVIRIEEEAFGVDVDGDEIIDHSTIPSNIKNLVFETDDNKHSSCAEIRDHAFACAPFKNIKLAMGIEHIYRFAFTHSDVEECYFPPYLRSVDEEAFSYTKLKRVVFNSVRQSYSGVYPKNPWLFANVGPIIENSQVEYVGKKAFYGCQDLTYLKPSLNCKYVLNDELPQQIFETGRSPFAAVDPATSSPLCSNIKYLDLSDLYLRNGETLTIKEAGSDDNLSLRQAFGIDIQPNITTPIEPTHLIKDKFIITEGYLWETGDTNTQIAYLNTFNEYWGAEPITTLECPNLGDWFYASNSKWNVNFKTIRPMINPSIQPTEITESALISYPDYLMCTFANYNYTDSDEGKHSMSIIPSDLEVVVNNYEWDNGEYDGPAITASIQDTGTVDQIKVIFEWEGVQSQELNGHTVKVSLTFSSKQLRTSYTFGPNNIYDSSGAAKLSLDSSIGLHFNCQ